MEITKEFVEQNKDKRFTFVFENGLILKNIKLFVSGTGVIAYLSGRQKRRGYSFPLYQKIKEVIEVKKKVFTDIDNAKTILKKIHPNVWPDIQEDMKRIINGGEISQDFDWHYKGKLKFKNISSLLNSHEKNRLREAFENKTDYNWSKPTYHHRGRDLSLSTQVGEDGKFRAWFSSEYMGCGNGDYYLLLNPTTAIFYETD